jgi:hypothetical protein
LRDLRRGLAAAPRTPRLEIDEQIGHALLQPEVVVVAERFAEQALVLANGAWAQTRGDVSRAARQILVELGDCVTARGGIEAFVL